MKNGNNNSLDLNNLEEELEFLLQENLTTANKTPSPIEFIPKMQKDSQQSIQPTNKIIQKPLSAKLDPSHEILLKNISSKEPPIVETTNLKDLYIEPTILEHKVENIEEEEPIAAILKEQEPAAIDETNLLSKTLEDFLSEETTEPIINTKNEPEVNLINNVFQEHTSFLNKWLNNITLSLLGVISLASAFGYYIYVYQPYAPSIIYADKSPYKTKNMIENLEDQNILSVKDLKAKQIAKLEPPVTIKQPFIKAIEKPAITQSPTTTPKISVKAPEPVKENSKIELITNPVEKTIINKKAFTDKDIGFDNAIAPQITNILKTKPAVIKKPKPIAKNLDPWEANQLKKSKAKFYVQFAATPVYSNALDLQKKYYTKYHNLINNRYIMVEKSNLISNKIYYRLRIKTSNIEDAKAICSKIKNIGGQCIYGSN